MTLADPWELLGDYDRKIVHSVYRKGDTFITILAEKINKDFFGGPFREGYTLGTLEETFRAQTAYSVLRDRLKIIHPKTLIEILPVNRYEYDADCDRPELAYTLVFHTPALETFRRYNYPEKIRSRWKEKTENLRREIREKRLPLRVLPDATAYFNVGYDPRIDDVFLIDYESVLYVPPG